MAPETGQDDGAHNYNVVFIDTSLDTHLAMIVSDSDIVSDFKRKITLEHLQLFPAIGDIKVESLKVKQRGSFYHLSDSMLVKSAFDAAKRNWFVSVDASRLEQNDGVQHTVNHKAGDQLALPWVTHSRSTEKHDNHGSPSDHSKSAPLVNQKVLNVDQLTSGGSYKDVSKNVEEDRLCNDKQLDYELQDMNLKKRTRDVHNESSPKDGFGHGPSLKKKRKTQRGKSDKALEENLALTNDNEKVNTENMFEHKTEGKDLRDEDNIINKGENCSAIDQVTTDVVTAEGVGSETVADVAMVVENNIQQEISVEMSQKEKDSELVQKTVGENEIPSSLMRTPDSEHDAAEVAVAGHVKRSTKDKTAENTNKDVTESSQQQDVGSNGQERADDQIDKHNDDLETSLKLKPELKLPERKKGAKGSEKINEGKRRKAKKVFKHADNLMSDISSTVIDETKINEVSEKTLIEANKGDDMVMKEVEVPVENIEENSRKEFTDTNDVVTVTVTNEDNLIPHTESLMNNDAHVSISGKNTSQVHAQGMLDNIEKQNEKTDDTTKKKKKRKTKRSSGRNEHELVTKHVDGDIIENVDRKDDDKVKEKDAQISYEVEIESKKSQSVDQHHLPEETLKNVNEFEVSNVNNEVDNLKDGFHELDSVDNFAPGHQPKTAFIDNNKDVKKTKVSDNVFKDPNMTNIDKTKPTKRTKKIDAQKTNKQQPYLVQTRVKTAVKKSLNRSQKGKSLLNTIGTVFGSDSEDDATVNSDTKKHAPYRKPSSSSSSSSSSGEIYPRRSYARKGTEGAGKNNINSQSKLKNTSIGNLLRSSSAFKKAKVTASSRVDDTESQLVDFVPESQL